MLKTKSVALIICVHVSGKNLQFGVNQTLENNWSHLGLYFNES